MYNMLFKANKPAKLFLAVKKSYYTHILMWKKMEKYMKKFFVCLCLIFIAGFVFANDTYFFMSAGQLIPTEEKNIEVEMQEEIINIVLEQRYYEVTVDFFFYNYGDSVDLEIGFPFFCTGLQGDGKISDFKCWTDGIETSYTDYPIEKEWAKDTELEYAYVRSINFPSKKLTKTKITYKSTYGSEAPSYSIAKYLYGTGSSWKNAIGKMTVRIQNKKLYSRINYISMPTNAPLKRIADDTWEGVYTNIEPEKYTASITITCGDLFGDDGPRILQKDRFFGCCKELTSDDLFFYTKPQLQLIRNAIYAFSGYPFETEYLKEFFDNKAKWGWFGWDKLDDEGNPVYPLDINFTEDKLTEIEKHNIKIILEEENKR